MGPRSGSFRESPRHYPFHFEMGLVFQDLAVGQHQWDTILGYVNSPPILEPMVGIGMFTIAT